MPKDRGGPDQGIFQDLWTGGVSEGLGVTTFFFACHPRKGVNKSLAPTRGPPRSKFFGVAGGPLNRGAPCHGIMVNPSLDVKQSAVKVCFSASSPILVHCLSYPIK
jgi:hypothetical protein